MAGTCGSCTAGILIGVNGNEIQRCDGCGLFESDDDAVAAVQELGKVLHKLYVRGGDDAFTAPDGRTVADAFDQLDATDERIALAEAAPDLIAALQRLVNSPVAGSGDYILSERDIDVARAAIAKATEPCP